MFVTERAESSLLAVDDLSSVIELKLPARSPFEDARPNATKSASAAKTVTVPPSTNDGRAWALSPELALLGIVIIVGIVAVVSIIAVHNGSLVPVV